MVYLFVLLNMVPMEKVTLNIESFREIIENLPSDDGLQNYKQELLNEISSDTFVVLNNQFFYITDLRHFNNVYIHKNLNLILGYEPDYFKSMENVYSLIHPEDRDFVMAFSKKIITHSREVRNIPSVQQDPLKISFSIDFRIRKSSGQFIRVNRVTSCIKLDRKGNVVYAISVYTDIDRLKKSNHISCSWSGDESGLFSVDDLIKEYSHSIFSDREVEILKNLAEGRKGKEISVNLRISRHTVISHRRKMLQKAQVKNTPELIHFAVSKGII
jgi:DNA-binding CsgD family transcriptional regulator/PAS domain-containing protein